MPAHSMMQPHLGRRAASCCRAAWASRCLQRLQTLQRQGAALAWVVALMAASRKPQAPVELAAAPELGRQCMLVTLLGRTLSA